jgi:hypothetical protein
VAMSPEAVGYAMETAEACGVPTNALEHAINSYTAKSPSVDLLMGFAKGRAMRRTTRLPFSVNNCVNIADVIRNLTLAFSGKGLPSTVSADYSKIGRGQKMAEDCWVTNAADPENCILNGMRQTASDDSLSMGFTYFVFVVHARDEEMLRNSPHPDTLKESYRRNVKANFALLQILEKKLRLPIADLCQITKTNCALEQRMVQYWRDQTPTAATYAQPSTAPAPPSAPAPSPMFQRGLADRTVWEQWISSLSGDYRTGADYWAGQRSLLHRGSCQRLAAFTAAGCEGAKARLTPADVLRKSDPDYKLGWNAYGH